MFKLCFRAGERRGEEELPEDYQALERRGEESAQGARRAGLQSCEEGHTTLHEGQGDLRPVSDARSGKWGSPTACLSEGCLLV